MRALEIKRGQRFGRLTVIRELPKIPDSDGVLRRIFKLQCECGTECEIRLIQLTAGGTQSCGCLQRETIGDLRRSHGMSGTPTYEVWCDMRRRCENPRTKSYPNYGGRGIKVCKRWHKFENFLADMGERPGAGYEIDRINNDGDYKPTNVRWTNDGRAQTRNRRKPKDGTAKYRGVDRTEHGWRARIAIDGTTRYLGTFKTERDAALAYDVMARRHKGHLLNFP